MTHGGPERRRGVLRTAGLVVALFASGCGGQERFPADNVLRASVGLDREAAACVDRVLDTLLGDPDSPRIPDAAPALARLVSIDRLRAAAGPVRSNTPGETAGLWRRHCARCHGIGGDGAGPTAYFQAPPPRDFRRGVVKWKSTWRDAPPTADDLRRVIEHGVPTTAMPSFRLVREDERESLRQYVVYLAVRGMVERELVRLAADDPAWDEPAGTAAEYAASEIVEPIARQWEAAESRVSPVAVPPTHDPTAIRRGEELFHSEAAGCAKCHGPSGQGGGVQDIDYDIWTRQRVDLAAAAGDDRAALDALANTLPSRPLLGRRLVGAPLHGGDSPADLFRRLHQGIAGTPMPALGPRRPGEDPALTDEDIAALAAYTRKLVAPQSPTAAEKVVAAGHTP